MNLPEPLVVNDPNAICSTNPTWTSSLGIEWDLFSVPVTIPAGSNYLIIQGNSEDNTDGSGNVLANCGSLHSSTFSLVVPVNLFCVEPTATAFAIQPSCTDGTVDANTGYLQISAASNATAYNFIAGSDYAADGGDIDIANATAFDPSTDLPLKFGALPNPTGTQEYTIRVFNGESSCFTDVTVTMNEQDCTVGCDCEEYLYLNDEVLGVVHKFKVNRLDGSLTEITDANGNLPFINGASLPGGFPRPHGLATDNNGFIYIARNVSDNDNEIYKFNCAGELIEEDFIGAVPYGRTNFVSANSKERQRTFVR